MHLGFWDVVKQKGLKADEDALSLMRVCQRMWVFYIYCWVPRPGRVLTWHGRYLELCGICTFSFDSLDTLAAFTKMYPILPVRHLQIVLYAHPLTCREYEENPFLVGVPSVVRKGIASWERRLEEVDRACRRIPGLASLLVSLHPESVYQGFKSEKKMIQSLKSMAAAQTLSAEVIGGGVKKKSEECVKLR
jgi:hypothetical protein